MPASSASLKYSLGGEFMIGNRKKEIFKPQTEIMPKNERVLYQESSGEKFIKNSNPKTLVDSPQKQSPGPFTALSFYPDGVVFKDQKADEQIIILVRRHLITNIPWILGLITLSLVPVVAIPILPSFFPFINLSVLTQIAIIILYYLSLFAFLLINFTVWYFHIGIVTNERIIDIDTSGILYRNVAETKLELVEDISYTQSGAISSFFNYGDIDIQTAGTNPNFEFDKAPDPAKIRHTIGQLIGNV